MRKTRWPLLALVGLLIMIGGVFIFKRVTLLQLENLDQGRVLILRVDPSEPFSLFYIHSIYLEPAIEEFVIEGEAIVLKGVRTKSSGVMEYYGFQEVKEFHPLSKRLGVVNLKRGTFEGQALITRERKVSLSEIAEIGDRIQLKAKTVSLGTYLFKRYVKP